MQPPQKNRNRQVRFQAGIKEAITEESAHSHPTAPACLTSKKTFKYLYQLPGQFVTMDP